MTVDRDTPELVAYRLQLLEGKVDQLHEKFDLFHRDVVSKQCSAPGTCLQLSSIVTRLDAQQQKHDTELEALKTQQVEAKHFIRGAIWVAGAVGSLLGMLGPAIFAAAKAIFVGKT